MAAATLTTRLLAESEETILLEGIISQGGTDEVSPVVFADMSEYTIGGASTTLAINRVWWSCQNLSIVLKFDADTDDIGLYLSGVGRYDFSNINGIKNPESTGFTGDILLTTYGIAINSAKDTVGSIVLECKKIRY